MFFSFFFFEFYYTKLTFYIIGVYNIYLFLLNDFYINFFFITIIIFLIKKNYNLYYKFYIFIFFLNFLYENLLKTFFIGLLKIHPIVFYISLIILIINIFFINNNNMLFINLLSLFILSFLFGMIWALNQTSWNRYWSYDTIEFFYIFLILLIIINFHKLKLKIFFENFFYFNILFLIVLLRLNLIVSRHNFISLNTFSLKFKIFFFLFFFFTIINDFFEKKKNIFIINNNFYIWIIFIILIFFNFISYPYIKNFILTNFIVCCLWFFFFVNFTELKNKKLHFIAFLIISLFIINKIVFMTFYSYKSIFFTSNFLFYYNIIKSFYFYKFNYFNLINTKYNKIDNIIDNKQQYISYFNLFS